MGLAQTIHLSFAVARRHPLRAPNRQSGTGQAVWLRQALQGQVAISYKLFRAWVSEFQALPEFDAGTMNAVGIQTITLQHEGWERV